MWSVTCVSLYVYVRVHDMYVSMHTMSHMEVRRQLCGASSLLSSLHGLQGSKSGQQSCEVSTLHMSHPWPKTVHFLLSFVVVIVYCFFSFISYSFSSFFLPFFLFFNKAHIMYPWLTWNLLSRLGWPGTHRASTTYMCLCLQCAGIKGLQKHTLQWATSLAHGGSLWSLSTNGNNF